MTRCLHCNEELKSEHAIKFCNRSCAAKYNNAHREIKPEWWDHLRTDNRCSNCGTQLKSSRFRFCSQQCKEEKMKPKKHVDTSFTTSEIFIVFEQNFDSNNTVQSVEFKPFKDLEKARIYFLAKVDAFLASGIKDTFCKAPANWRDMGISFKDPLWSIEIFKSDLII